MPVVLIAEDEQAIAEPMQYALRTEGLETEHCLLAREVVPRVRRGGVDLVVLDVGLPDGSGFDVCRELRTFSEVPVIFLTARNDVVDRVLGLELGADDYMCKPFSPRELVARVRARLRREPTSLAGSAGAGGTAAGGAGAGGAAAGNAGTGNAGGGVEATRGSGSGSAGARSSGNAGTGARSSAAGNVGAADGEGASDGWVTRGDFAIDREGHRIRFRGQLLELTRYEHALLTALLARPGAILNRAQLMARGWDSDADSADRTVDTHIKTLRAKLRGAGAEKELIRTYRGLGYALEP